MAFAMVFPGQGSQAVGMMNGFDAHASVRDTFEEASGVLGQDFWAMAKAGPAEALNLTVNTQPLMLTAGVAVYRAWGRIGGPQPALMAGHSLGEYTALVCAGALRFSDALPLVRYRAQAMQEAVPVGEGAMAAIFGLDGEPLRQACMEAAQGQVVEPVNFNAPGQTVIAGNKAAVERGVECAKARGAKRAMMLPVSAPFHSSLLKPAADRLAEYLGQVEFNVPIVPVLNNVDVAVQTDPQRIKESLARQACNAVRWVELIEAMAHRGIANVIECGPGKILTGLTRRIAPGLQGHSIADDTSMRQAFDAVS